MLAQPGAAARAPAAGGGGERPAVPDLTQPQPGAERSPPGHRSSFAELSPLPPHQAFLDTRFPRRPSDLLTELRALCGPPASKSFYCKCEALCQTPRTGSWYWGGQKVSEAESGAGRRSQSRHSGRGCSEAACREGAVWALQGTGWDVKGGELGGGWDRVPGKVPGPVRAWDVM